MNLVADEGVERQIVEQLRQEGHAVIYVAELAPSISGDEVLQQANERQAVLVGVAITVVALVAILVSVPYWHAIGLA